MNQISEVLSREDSMRVRRIERGTVIDHLPAGTALAVLRLLGVNESFPGTVSVLINSPSTQYGLKDMVKIEGRDFSTQELERLSILAPYATVNIVRNWRVVEKFRVRLPDEIEGSTPCPNGNCISRTEGKSRLRVEGKSPVRLRCAYCEKLFGESDLFLRTPSASLEKWMRT